MAKLELSQIAVGQVYTVEDLLAVELHSFGKIINNKPSLFFKGNTIFGPRKILIPTHNFEDKKFLELRFQITEVFLNGEDSVANFVKAEYQGEPEALIELVTFSLFLNSEVTEEGVDVIAKIGSYPSRQVFRYVNNGESLLSDYGFTYPVPDELNKAQKLLDDNKGVIIIL